MQGQWKHPIICKVKAVAEQNCQNKQKILDGSRTDRGSSYIRSLFGLVLSHGLSECSFLLSIVYQADTLENQREARRAIVSTWDMLADNTASDLGLKFY